MRDQRWPEFLSRPFRERVRLLRLPWHWQRSSRQRGIPPSPGYRDDHIACGVCCSSHWRSGVHRQSDGRIAKFANKHAGELAKVPVAAFVAGLAPVPKGRGGIMSAEKPSARPLTLSGRRHRPSLPLAGTRNGSHGPGGGSRRRSNPRSVTSATGQRSLPGPGAFLRQ